MTKEKSASIFKTLLPALFVMALWGSMFPMIKLGYSALHIAGDDIPTIILFAGARFVVGGILLSAFTVVRDKKNAIPCAKDMSYILLGALFTIILHYTFNYIGLSLGEGSKTAIIKQISYLFLTCFAFTFDKSEKFSYFKIAAGALGFLGIIATGFDGTRVTFGAGDFLVLLASVSSAAGAIVSKNATRVLSPVKFVAYSQLFGGVLLFVAGLLMGGRITNIDIKGALVFAYICTASLISYLIWNMLLKKGSLSRLSLIKFTEPLFAVVLSGLILGEEIFRISYLLAFILMILAITVEHIPDLKHKKDK